MFGRLRAFCFAAILSACFSPAVARADVDPGTPLPTQLREMVTVLGGVVFEVETTLLEEEKLANFEVQDLMSRLRSNYQTLSNAVAAAPDSGQQLCNARDIRAALGAARDEFRAINARLSALPGTETADAAAFPDEELRVLVDWLLEQKSEFHDLATAAEGGC